MSNMMNSEKLIRIRKAFLYSFIVFLSISAMLAISSVLSGDFSDFEVKILLSTSIIALTSICALCCSAYLAKSKALLFPMIGIILAALSALSLLLGIWAEIDSEEFWKSSAIISIFAVAFAHCLALLSVNLSPGKNWLRILTGITLFLNSAIISSQIIDGDLDDDVLKVLAVLSILGALETLVIPILGRVAKAEPVKRKESITLTKRDDGLYENNEGRLYRLEEMDREDESKV